MTDAAPLALHHAFLLLVHDDVKGTPVVDAFSLSLGFAAAMVGELNLRERLVPTAADTFVLRPGERSDGALGQAEARLEGFSGTMKKAIGRVANGGFLPRRSIRGMPELAELGAVREEPDHLLFVRWRTRWPIDDPTAKIALLARLDAWLDAADGPPCRDDLLLSLLRGARALPHLWDADRLDAARTRLERRTRLAPLGRLVRELVRDAETSAMVASTSFGPPATTDR